MRELTIAKITEYLTTYGEPSFGSRWSPVYEFVLSRTAGGISISTRHGRKLARTIDIVKMISDNASSFSDYELLDLLTIVVRRFHVCM